MLLVIFRAHRSVRYSDSKRPIVAGFAGWSARLSVCLSVCWPRLCIMQKWLRRSRWRLVWWVGTHDTNITINSGPRGGSIISLMEGRCH